MSPAPVRNVSSPDRGLRRLTCGVSRCLCAEMCVDIVKQNEQS